MNHLSKLRLVLAVIMASVLLLLIDICLLIMWGLGVLTSASWDLFEAVMLLISDKKRRDHLRVMAAVGGSNLFDKVFRHQPWADVINEAVKHLEDYE